VSDSTPRSREALALEVFLVSFALLLLQISYTRVFSFKISSYFTYLVIGFAMLGVGSGGVFVALSARLRSAPLERLIAAAAPLGAAAVVLGYGAVLGLELRLYEHSTSAGQIARLALLCGVLFAGFLSMGLVIAAIFARRAEAIHALYFADLAGAGLGCAAAIPLLALLTPPGGVFAAAAALALAGLRPALAGARRLAPACAALALVLAGGAVLAERLPDPVVDPAKHMGREKLRRLGPVVFRQWSPVFRIDVLEVPARPELKALVHDGMWGSALWQAEREAPRLAQAATTTRRLPFAVATPEPHVLIIGAAGGFEILASLEFGAGKVTAVELNPVTVSLLREHFADFTGHLAEHEKVTLVNAEGRAFLRRDASQYDVVYFVAPDSYATMNSAQASGFVLVESYLYTVEAVREALERLAPQGVLAMQFGEVDLSKPMRTPRYLATARRALEELGVRDFARHVLLATTPEYPFPTSTILLQRTPFTPQQIARFVETAGALPGSAVRHAFGHPRDPGAFGAVISGAPEKLPGFFERYPYAVHPISDDAPFFWHFTRFRDLLPGRGASEHFDPEVGKGETALLVMLAVSAAFAALFLLLPFAAAGTHFASLPRKGPVALYFAILGLAFMGFEIAMIQKLTLFLGYPTRTLSVTLFALLLFSGLGSLASGAYLRRRDAALPLLALGVLACALFYRSGLDPLVRALVSAPLALRIAVAVGTLAPLGFCLGAFMPLGIATVSRLAEGDRAREYVAWAWAVNGFFSVIGSLLVTMLSMSYGFRAVLALAAGLYALAALVLWRIPLEASQAARAPAAGGERLSA
jgi:spermidine synthase